MPDPAAHEHPGSEAGPAQPWYVEHRLRALLLFVTCLLIFGAIVFTVVYVTTVNRLKETDAYADALQQVQQSPAVQNQLGRPIEAMWRAAGQVSESTRYGEMIFRVQGPTGKGTVRAKTELEDDGWQLVFLDVACYSDFGVSVIELIGDKPPTGPDLPEPTEEAKERYGLEESSD